MGTEDKIRNLEIDLNKEKEKNKKLERLLQVYQKYSTKSTSIYQRNRTRNKYKFFTKSNKKKTTNNKISFFK